MAFHHDCGTGRGKVTLQLLVIAGVFSVVISLFGIPELLNSIGGDSAAKITAIFCYGFSAVLLIALVGMAFDDKFCDYEAPVTGKNKSFLSRPFYWDDMGLTKEDVGKVTGALVGKPVKVYVKGTEKSPYKQYYVDLKLSPVVEDSCKTGGVTA